MVSVISVDNFQKRCVFYNTTEHVCNGTERDNVSININVKGKFFRTGITKAGTGCKEWIVRDPA